MSHGDQVTALPPGFKLIACTDSAPIAGMADEERRFYALQFHPEVTHTHQGAAHAEPLRARHLRLRGLVEHPQHHRGQHRSNLRAQVGDDEVILGLSGGVDSSVVAALLHRAIGDQLTCVFVDTGLLRLNEGDQVMATFAQHMGVRVIRVDAEARYSGAHCRALPIRNRSARSSAGCSSRFSTRKPPSCRCANWLAQGTIYPDVIESAGAKTGKAHVIKSHHNVGGLPAHMKLKLLEPLRELFKDEVREAGAGARPAAEMVYRHPFPGPGLGVRILGEVKRNYADLLRRADAIFIEELRTGTTCTTRPARPSPYSCRSSPSG